MSGIPTSDYFCGGGGSSTGLWLTGQFDIDSGYNHSKLATEVHALNHPGAEHYVVDLHLEDPRRTRRTPFAWFSPECTKWSRAAGAKYAHVPIDGGDLLDLLDPELVAADLEVTQSAIVQTLKRNGIKPRSAAEEHRGPKLARRALTPEQELLVVEDYEATGNAAAVARKHGIGETTARNILRRRGVASPPAVGSKGKP